MEPPGSQFRKPSDAVSVDVTGVEHDGYALIPQTKQICTGDVNNNDPTTENVKL
jgi:hypothetical protein